MAGDRTVLLERIRLLVSGELSRGAAARDRAGIFPRKLWKRSAAAGLHGLAVPKKDGGSGLDAGDTFMVLEELGYRCEDGGFAFAVGAQLLSCAVPLSRLGGPSQRRYLKRLCGGDLIAAHAITEPEGGSDVYAMRTTASRQGRHFTISGKKSYVTLAPQAGLFIVYAVTDATRPHLGRLTAFLLPRSTRGLKLLRPVEKMGLRSCPMGEIELKGVRVSQEQALGGLGAGSAVFSLAMAWERAGLAAVQTGVIRRLFDRTVQHSRTRKAFGQTIGRFQAVSHRIADIRVQLEASRLLFVRAALALDRGEDAILESSMAKLFASESLVKTALGALQTLGAQGYLAGGGTERDLRDALGGTIYSGTSDIQRNLIARLSGTG